MLQNKFEVICISNNRSSFPVRWNTYEVYDVIFSDCCGEKYYWFGKPANQKYPLSKCEHCGKAFHNNGMALFPSSMFALVNREVSGNDLYDTLARQYHLLYDYNRSNEFGVAVRKRINIATELTRLKAFMNRFEKKLTISFEGDYKDLEIFKCAYPDFSEIPTKLILKYV